MMNPLSVVADAQTLAQAIVDTIHEPLLVLDGDLRVMAASRSFYEGFRVDPAQTSGCLLYDLGDGQWDIPALRILLETIIPQQTAMDDFEVDHDFPGLGRRVILLNARMVRYATGPDRTILLAFTDVTARRAIESEKAALLVKTEELLIQQKVLLAEIEHRVANSLQIIASILLLKAKAVTSEETRVQLRDAHQRVMSVAAVQLHLHAVDGIDQIGVGPYLTKLAGSLSASMIGEDHPITLTVTADDGMIGSAQAVSLGLIVTELVINAIKYAFPGGKADAHILVSYESDGDDWRLCVSDNGCGSTVTVPASESNPGGLGTAIVAALVSQLESRLEITSSDAGLRAIVTRSTFTSRPPLAA